MQPRTVVTLTATRNLRVFLPDERDAASLKQPTVMGNARDEPLKYEATCMSGDVMSVHPTTIRDTWLVVIHWKIHQFHFQKMLQEMFWKNFWQKRLSESHGYVKLLPLSSSRGAFRCLRCFHQVIDVNVKVVIKLDEVDRGLGFHLMNNHASSFRAVLFGIFHLLPHEAVHHLSGLTLRWGRVVCNAWE